MSLILVRMPRRLREAGGGICYHVLNRAVGRATIFETDEDYVAFFRCVNHASERVPTMRVLGEVVMPNHWHLVLWPKGDGELSEFMRLMTVTHTQRWRANRHTAGTGPLYQGRFKSFPIERDEHLLTVLRYVDRNPLRAGLVERAEQWPWGGLALSESAKPPDWLTPGRRWPVRKPADWVGLVNTPQPAEEEAAVQASIRRERPFGTAKWVAKAAKAMGLDSTLRPRGRPSKRSGE